VTASRTLVIGHKGASIAAPENTLASFSLALDLGADGIECDIRATEDGVPVIIHDETVDRTTNGSGEIARLQYKQVKKLDASGGNRDFAGQVIPTLGQLLDLVAGRCLLVLEFKSMDAVRPAVPLLEARDAVTWCTAWSFRPEILAELRRYMPEMSRSLLVGTAEDWGGKLATAAELDCMGISVRQDLVDSNRVRSARSDGLVFYAWTANDPADWRRLIDAGVDAIVTDDPGGLRKLIGA
jgi:glycerophosphoryl diester phosphodiesterase